MKIGFIGLGIMGSRMAANLQKHGYELVVFNRTRSKAQPLLDKGAVFADSPAKLGAQVDILFTMLAHPDAVAQAALRANGFLDHLMPNALWVDCSSVNPSFSKKMATGAAARQIRFLDAPVTGSAPVAAEGKLVFWVGGDAADLEGIRPLLLCMGNKIVHAGGHGMGTSMKMVINLLLGIGMASFAEAMALGQGLGLSQEMLFDSLLGMPAVPAFLASKREKIEKGNYEVEFPLRWMQKDMHLASVSAYEAGLAMPVTNLTKEIYRFAMRGGHDTEDFSAIYEFVMGESGRNLETTRRKVAYWQSRIHQISFKVPWDVDKEFTGSTLVNALATQPAFLDAGAKPARISRTAATLLAVALVAVIAWFDYSTGDFSLAVFYLAPVVLATWYAGRPSGWFIGLLSAAAWLLADQPLSQAGSEPLRPYWDAAMLALIYGIVAHLLSAIERLQAELRNRVEQRTASLAEVHHRVKNNLQIISSLLMLQAEKLTSAADKAVFGECRDRIYSMARLHEQLYSSGQFSDLDFAAHLREMAEMLVRSHTPPGCVLALEVLADPVAMDLDTAVTLGLIANELLLNALKHGFGGRTAGKLTVELRAGNPNQMTVRDDGSGLPPGFEAKQKAGLGIELVLGMTQQIHGEAKIENDPAGGTRTTIFFPSLPPSKTEPRAKPTYHD